MTKLNLITDLVCEQHFADEAMRDPTFTFMPVVLGKDNPQCDTPEVSALTSEFLLVGMLLSGLFSAIIAPLLGAYSDRHGRLHVIAVSSLGIMLGEIITIVVAKNSDVLSVYWILLGYLLEGVAGSFTTGMAVSNAYASDCTPPAKRAKAFALFHACLFTGIALGPLISAGVVQSTGDILDAFYVAIGAHVFFISFMAFIVPESLSQRRQLEAREKWRLAELLAKDAAVHSTDRGSMRSIFYNIKNSHFVKTLQILRPEGIGSSSALRRNLGLLAAIDTTCFGVGMGSITVTILYSKLEFKWGNKETQYFISIANICRVSVLVAVLPLLNRIFHKKQDPSKGHRHTGADNFDLGIIRLAILFDVLGYVGYAVSGAMSSPGFFVLSGCLAASGGMVSPTLQSALTRHIPPDRTGQLLGAVALLHAVARILAPAIFSGLYALTVKDFPQTVFACLASAFTLAELMSWFVRPHSTSKTSTIKVQVANPTLVFFDEPAATESRPGTSGSDELRQDDLIQVG